MSETNIKKYADSALIDLLLRLCVAAAVGFFALRAFNHWRSDPARITVLLIAIVEVITFVIILCSRRALQRDWRPLSLLSSGFAMFYFLALGLAPASQLLPELAGASLQVAGLLVQLYAKLSLGRSFGVLPATRKLVTHGAYRYLRHPIYFGYLIAHTGFLLSNFSMQNFMVIFALCLAQLVRIAREEEMLLRLPGYRDYCRSVRYRIIPMLY